MEHELYKLVQLIKKAAQEEVQAGRPMRIAYGVVLSTEPLIISTDAKNQLPEEFIEVPVHFTDHEVTVELGGIDTNYLIKNALRVGDKVTMLQQAGGQRYLIVDRRKADVT